MDKQTDGDLIGRAQAGDFWALDEFLDRHKRTLLYYLWGETCNKVAADELYNDTLFEFHEAYINIKKPEAARNYLFKIAYNNFINWKTKENRRNSIAKMVPILDEDEKENYSGASELSDDGDFIDRLDRQMDAEKRIAELMGEDKEQKEILPPGTATPFRSGGALKRK